jgi:hypothetical protein
MSGVRCEVQDKSVTRQQKEKDMTSAETKAKFPIGARVRTTDKNYRLKRQQERFATVRGYCDQSGSDLFMRVTWEEWKQERGLEPTFYERLASTVAVNSASFEPVTAQAGEKIYLLVEVDNRDEAIGDLRQCITDMLQPEDGQDILVRVFELEHVGFEGRQGNDLYRDVQMLDGISNVSMSGIVKTK